MFSSQKTECSKASIKPTKGSSKMTKVVVLPKPPAAVNRANKETGVPKVGSIDTVLILNLICNLEL